MEQVNPTLERLEDQIKWYSKKSTSNKKWFKWLKILEIIIASLIPLFAAANISSIVTAIFGAIVVVLEAIQGLCQFQSTWISYRSTAEGLKHEKYLWQANAGPYLTSENPNALLAERIEFLISTENLKWIENVDKSGKNNK